MAESKQETLNALNPEIIEDKHNKSYVLFKRVMDITLSTIGLILLFPILIIIASLIKLEDKNGPIIFKQERVGKEGRVFYMYKFRSMVSNAEDLLQDLMMQNEASGPLFKMKKDPRVTSVGKILRRTSLDELPQLFNVLKGDMSLVGPRPALPREVTTYSSYEKQRLSVTPGLTCFWQVEGRSNTTFEQQVELDLKYIRNRTIALDFKLILKTFKVFLGSKDAY